MKAFDSAWQLLKYAAYHEDDDYDDDDDVDPRINPGYNKEDLMLDDMDDAILEHEIRQLRQSPGFYDKPEPAVTEEERKLLRYIRKPKLTRVAPTQMAADPHSHVQPDNMKDIPGTMNEMGIAEANQFNSAMANRPEAKLSLQRHMDEVKRRKEEEEAALSEPFVPVHQQNQ